MPHWYVKESGVVKRYRPLKANGEEYLRIPTAMAMKAGAVVGVTDILKVLGDAGGLCQWFANHGVEAGLDVGMSAAAAHEPRNSLVAMAKAQCKEATTRAADEGKVIHDAIQQHLETGAVSEDGILRRAQNEANAWLGSMGLSAPFRCEHALYFRGALLGESVSYGGTTDLVTNRIIADWKTVELKAGAFRGPKWSEAAQLGAYRFAASNMGLSFAEARCYNLYFNRTDGALLHVQPWSNRALEHGLWLFVEAIRIGKRMQLLESCIARGK